jgi:hypothetical protein
MLEIASHGAIVRIQDRTPLPVPTALGCSVEDAMSVNTTVTSVGRDR